MRVKKVLKLWGILVLLASVIFAGLAFSQSHVSIAVSNTAVPLTGYTVGTKKAVITVESGLYPVRWTVGSANTPTTDPTSGTATGNGHFLAPGGQLILDSYFQIQTFRAIRATENLDSVLKVTFY